MISAKTYEEVFEVLSYMDKLTIMKIPQTILEKIANSRDKNFVTKIDKLDIFNLNNISEETIKILAFLDYTYCMEKEKKDKYRKMYYNNTLNNSSNQNNYEVKFNSRESSEEKKEEQKSIIKYKESIFKKIKRFLFGEK